MKRMAWKGKGYREEFITKENARLWNSLGGGEAWQAGRWRHGHMHTGKVQAAQAEQTQSQPKTVRPSSLSTKTKSPYGRK